MNELLELIALEAGYNLWSRMNQSKRGFLLELIHHARHNRAATCSFCYETEREIKIPIIVSSYCY